MKKIILSTAIAAATCISFTSSAQQNVFLQELPRLSEVEFTTIESNQSVRIKREAATRAPGQHNVIILSGNNTADKQNTARWLAQKINMPIYKISLSLVVAANFEETKRNLNIIFEAAKNKPWVLFFDEGDALFGRRRGVTDSHDRYDNEASDYFTRQVEKYRGSIILSVTASNNINPFIFEKYVRFFIH